MFLKFVIDSYNMYCWIHVEINGNKENHCYITQSHRKELHKLAIVNVLFNKIIFVSIFSMADFVLLLKLYDYIKICEIVIEYIKKWCILVLCVITL